MAKTRRKPITVKPLKAMEAKTNEVLADRYLHGVRRNRPDGTRDPDFDREAAIKILCDWGARVISAFDDLYDTFDDVSTALERSQDMYDLFGEQKANVIHTIASELDRLSSDAYKCVPHVLDLPDTLVLTKPMLRK